MAAMCETVEWIGRTRLELVKDVPIKALNISVRKLYGRFLDPPGSLSPTGLQQDWMGLAELMEMDCDEIQALSAKEEKTMHLIQQWSQQSNSTIGRFIKFLEQLQRYDILEHEVLQNRILEDVERYHKKQEELNQMTSQTLAPIQDPEVSSNLSDPRCSGQADISMETEFTNITVGEVDTGKPEFFEAFVCYSEKDFGFVKQMIAMLEGRHSLKLCIKDRDILPGSAKDSVVAHLIAQRCKKMIIILSPSFFKCAECDFMTKFGHALSPGARNKKLIPIVIQQPCPIPDILRYITQVDWTKCELVEWFWWRVARSLQESSFIDPDTLYGRHAAQERSQQMAQQAALTPPTDASVNSEETHMDQDESQIRPGPVQPPIHSQEASSPLPAEQDTIPKTRLNQNNLHHPPSQSGDNTGQPNRAYCGSTSDELTSSSTIRRPAWDSGTPLNPQQPINIPNQSNINQMQSRTPPTPETTYHLPDQYSQSSFSTRFDFYSIPLARSALPIPSEDGGKKKDTKKGKKKSKKDKPSDEVKDTSPVGKKFQFF